jgi:hypothetical protein
MFFKKINNFIYMSLLNLYTSSLSQSVTLIVYIAEIVMEFVVFKLWKINNKIKKETELNLRDLFFEF